MRFTASLCLGSAKTAWFSSRTCWAVGEIVLMAFRISARSVFLGEMVEVLDQHSRRRGRPDGREGLDGGDALRLLSALHHLVEMRDGDLVAEGAGRADGCLADAEVGVVDFLHEEGEDLFVVVVLQQGEGSDLRFSAQRGGSIRRYQVLRHFFSYLSRLLINLTNGDFACQPSRHSFYSTGA